MLFSQATGRDRDVTLASQELKELRLFLGSIEVKLRLYWGYIGILEKKMETTIL